MGKGKKGQDRGGHGGNLNGKAAEREVRRGMQRQRQRRQYGDASWKKDFDNFLAQLRLLNLTIKDVAGDGNCLFRAIADQVEGDPTRHADYRRRVCECIEANRDGFEPFVEDDEPFDAYVERMKKNATWGGQIEIQAASLALTVNITIHQLDQPRWQVINYPQTQRMIHLSYHDGEHYSSVRSLDDKALHAPPKAIQIVDKSKDRIEKEEKERDKGNKSSPVSEEELTIMEVTGCANRAFVQQLLLDNWGDVNACIDFIYMFQKEYLNDKKAEASGISSSSSSYSKNSGNSKNSPSPSPSNHKGNKRNSEEENDEEKEKDEENEKEEKDEVKVDSHGRVKRGAHPDPHTKPPKKEPESESSSSAIDPSIHPKLRKFYEKQLTNKERQGKARQEKQPQPAQTPKAPVISEAQTDVVDVTEVAKDLGSMMI